MERINQLSGILAPMLEANIDTDVIMPKQFLKGIDRQGLDKGIFDRRFLADGQPDPDFILNQPGWQGATFLLTGPNFGCGSSREHAVWGLRQLGIRALLGTSFAGIFDDNCLRNGILTVALDDTVLTRLSQRATDPMHNHITVSLEQSEIIAGDDVFTFSIDTLKREILSGGEDAISWTLQYQTAIEQFEAQHYAARPWLKRPVIAGERT